jgi:glycine cleavage system H protein
MVALLVVLMVGGVLAVDLLVRAYRKRRGVTPLTRQVEIPLPEWAVLPLSQMRFPAGLFYGRGHTWMRVGDDGTLETGIDDFLNRAIGPVEKIEVLSEGTAVGRGEPFARLTQGDLAVWVRSPVSGVIKWANSAAQPDQLEQDPYGAGWLARIEPKASGLDFSGLRFGNQVAEWIRAEALRFGRFLAGFEPRYAMANLQDGGVPVARRLWALGPERAQAFEHDFLLDREEA